MEPIEPSRPGGRPACAMIVSRSRRWSAQAGSRLLGRRGEDQRLPRSGRSFPIYRASRHAAEGVRLDGLSQQDSNADHSSSRSDRGASKSGPTVSSDSPRSSSVALRQNRPATVLSPRPPRVAATRRAARRGHVSRAGFRRWRSLPAAARVRGLRASRGAPMSRVPKVRRAGAVEPRALVAELNAPFPAAGE
jgi:hypothetical protein